MRRRSKTTKANKGECSMITKTQAQALTYNQTLHYTGRTDCKRTVGPRGGVKEYIVHVRVSGACKVWVTRPEEFRVPVKYGMYESFEINQDNGADFHLPGECPIEVQAQQARTQASDEITRALAQHS
jgi:hypothetical protein